MARTWPVAGFTLAVLWLFVRGVELTVSALAGEFLIGVAVGMPIAYVSRRFYESESNVRHAVSVSPYAALYLITFLKELLVANVVVAYRVLAPSQPIEPAVITFPLRVDSDLAITSIANSITLTPGTLTMDHDESENALFVHAIYCDDPAEVTRPIRRWEEYALVIFDEEGDPGDPVPEVSFESMEESESRIATDEEPSSTDEEVIDDGE